MLFLVFLYSSSGAEIALRSNRGATRPCWCNCYPFACLSTKGVEAHLGTPSQKHTSPNGGHFSISAAVKLDGDLKTQQYYASSSLPPRDFQAATEAPLQLRQRSVGRYGLRGFGKVCSSVPPLPRYTGVKKACWLGMTYTSKVLTSRLVQSAISGSAPPEDYLR